MGEDYSGEWRDDFILVSTQPISPYLTPCPSRHPKRLQMSLSLLL